MDTRKLPQAIQDLVYKPEEDENYNVNLEFKGNVGSTQESLIDQPEIEDDLVTD